jgi:hypothetical protein
MYKEIELKIFEHTNGLKKPATNLAVRDMLAKSKELGWELHTTLAVSTM